MHVPAEIIVEIYCLLDTRLSIVSLAATSHQFHQVWRKNTAKISESVLNREIPMYGAALSLLELQHYEDEPKLVHNHGYWGTLRRNKLLLQNARLVSKQFSLFKLYAESNFHKRPTFRFQGRNALAHSRQTCTLPRSPLMQHAGFASTYYRIWIVVCLHDNPGQAIKFLGKMCIYALSLMFYIIEYLKEGVRLKGKTIYFGNIEEGIKAAFTLTWYRRKKLIKFDGAWHEAHDYIRTVYNMKYFL